VEIGVYTFADVSASPEQRLRELLEEVELAEQVGLDVFGVGEHHRPDYAISAPAVVLGAAAARTERIRLTSAVSVLSSDDPVRVFEQFATLDLLSGGRAEIMAGRGSFIESFALFGYDLRDYDELFAENLELLLELRAHEVVTWKGKHRAPIEGRGVADTSQQAADEFFPHYASMMNRIGRERGWSGLTREDYDALRSLRGALVVGSVDEVVEKILFQHEIFEHDRFLAQVSLGTLPHAQALRAIELMGTEVVPKVRAALADRRP
jgi:alkanesulfonate monooxygenase SsuD/methylene tetrahydromethanopterin reductase-like flavin-dependent oxidoreductase (luciferase family)